MYSLYSAISQVPTTLSQRDLETEALLWKQIKCFPSTQRWRNLKTEQSPVILDLCLVWRKLGQENHLIIVRSSFFKKRRFQNVFRRTHENEKPTISYFSSLKNLSEKLRFHDELVWTVGQSVEI